MNILTYVSLLAFFVSHTTLAQVKQTSGGHASGGSQFSKNEKMDKKIAENFNAAMKFCYLNKTGTPIPFENIVDAHVFLNVKLRLSNFNKKNDSVNCSKDEVYSCLQLKADKYLVRKFISNELTIPYLMEVYEIDQWESQRILDFYKDLFAVEETNTRINIDAGTDTIKGN